MQYDKFLSDILIGRLNTIYLSPFIFGKGSDDCEYVVHTASPFFIAKIANEQDVDTNFFSLTINGRLFYEFAFFEEPPQALDELREILESASFAYPAASYKH